MLTDTVVVSNKLDTSTFGVTGPSSGSHNWGETRKGPVKGLVVTVPS